MMHPAAVEERDVAQAPRRGWNFAVEDLMELLASLFRRHGRRGSSSYRRPVERLESRHLLSTGPALADVHLVGSLHALRAVELTFSESLDPTTVQDKLAFQFGKPTPQSSSNGISIGDILGFLGRPKAKLVKSGKIQWSSVTYDDTTHTVMLTPIKPFNGQPFIRVLRVKGSGPHTLKDLAGNALYGGQDGFIRWKLKTGDGKHVQWVDADGDQVKLTLKGPGQLATFLRINGDPDPFVFVTGAKAKSVLTGTVKASGRGDGVANIAELEGVGGGTTNLLSSTSFKVNSTEA